jgi:hypothetical protein
VTYIDYDTGDFSPADDLNGIGRCCTSVKRLHTSERSELSRSGRRFNSDTG